MTQEEELFKKELIKELQTVYSLMKKEKDYSKKIYYFSAAYGITSRSYRYIFSEEVLLADLVLNSAYQSLQGVISKIKSGDSTIKIEDKHFDRIENALLLLAETFEKNGSIIEPLKIILTTSFSVTGPGNYLREKGMIKFE